MHQTTPDISPPAPRLLPCGDCALSVEFGDTIDEAVNARVLALDLALAAAPPAGLVETVPTYRALHVIFDPVQVDLPALKTQLLALARSAPEAAATGRLWRVPVVYGGAHGEDLAAAAATLGLTPAELVRRHSAATYRVAMIGFLPGFCYLSGLDPALALPRRSAPRLKVPASSISIGGQQAAVGSIEGPSGWHLLGRTPARPYMAGRTPAFLFAPGDHVTFAPVEAAEWARLDALAASGAPVAEVIAS